MSKILSLLHRQELIDQTPRPEPFWPHKLRALEWAELKVTAIDHHFAQCEVVDCYRREFVGLPIEISQRTGFVRRAPPELQGKIQLGAVLFIRAERGRAPGAPLVTLEKVTPL